MPSLMMNPRDIDFYGHMIIIPLVSNPVMAWSSHNGAPSNKRRKFKTFLIPAVLSCLFKKWCILTDKKVVPQKAVTRGRHPSERNVFPFFLTEAQVAASTANQKCSPQGRWEESPVAYHSILLSTRVDGPCQIHYGIKGFCGQPWESHHL